VSNVRRCPDSEPRAAGRAAADVAKNDSNVTSSATPVNPTHRNDSANVAKHASVRVGAHTAQCDPADDPSDCVGVVVADATPAGRPTNAADPAAIAAPRHLFIPTSNQVSNKQPGIRPTSAAPAPTLQCPMQRDRFTNPRSLWSSLAVTSSGRLSSPTGIGAPGAFVNRVAPVGHERPSGTRHGGRGSVEGRGAVEEHARTGEPGRPQVGESRTRGRIRGVTAALAVGLALGTACTSHEAAAPSATTSSSALPSQTAPPPSAPTNPSTTSTPSVPVTPEAVKFVADHVDELPVADQERACIAEQVAADPSMISRAATEPIQQVMAHAVTTCKQKVSFAEAFVVGMAQSHPDLTADQQDCLRRAYGALAPEDLDALMASGIQPRSAAAARGREVIADLLRGCEL